MLEVSIYVMAISSMTLAADMVVYFINGEGMFPYAESIEKMRFIFGILAFVVIIGALVTYIVKS